MKNSGLALINKGQVQSKARCLASWDFRNFLVTAVTNNCFAEGHDASMVGNFDGTQFHISFVNDEPLIKIIVRRADGEESDEEPYINSIVENSILDIVAKPVFLVADPSMRDDEFTVSEIRGLSISTDPAGSGYLGGVCYSFTRVIIVRTLEDREQSFFLTCDGEDIQMIAVFQDDEVGAVLIAHRIVGKGCATCSGTVGNACDRSNTFKASKKVLKHNLVGKSVHKETFTDPGLVKMLESDMRINYPKITSAKRKHIADGLVRIVKSLAQFYNSTRVSKVLRIKAALLAMKELFLRDHGLEGCPLTEADMDDLGIPDYFMEGDKRTTPKDQRAEDQQRCILISGESSRSRRKLYLERRELKKSEAAAKRNTKKLKSAAVVIKIKVEDNVTTVMEKSNEGYCDNDELEEIGTDDPVQPTITIPIEDTRPIGSFGPRRKLEASVGSSSIIAGADFNPEGQNI
eukprot:gene36267-47196_t